MVFDDIVGQYDIIKYLKNMIAVGRIGHAYLFCGADGVGKSLTASVFAAALNCRKKDVDPCGECSSCIKAKSGNHPDIIHVKIQHPSISVDDIRDLQRSMQKKPYENGVKVYIIYECEKMTEQAQNALLKTLEEPPAHAVVILLTNNQYSLLNTIMSRCQVLKFTRAPERAIEDYIIQKMGVDKSEARYIAAFSDGIFQKAVDFINNAAVKSERDEIIELTSELYKKDRLYALSRVDYFVGNKDRIDYILNVMMSWFRDLLIYKECSNTNFLINLDRQDIIIEECKRFTYNNLNSIISNIKRTMDNVRSNVNYQLSIENMLLKIQEG